MAGRKAATAIASKQEVVGPNLALAILRRLSLLKLPEAAEKLQVRISVTFSHVNSNATSKNNVTLLATALLFGSWSQHLIDCSARTTLSIFCYLIAHWKSEVFYSCIFCRVRHLAC